MQCGSSRRRSKKVSRRRHGGGYGFNQADPIGVGAASVSTNNTSDVGTVRPGNNEFSTTNLGGRRPKTRKSKKVGRRKSKKVRRGGGSIATVGQGQTGQGSRGLADVTGQVANPPGPVGQMGHQ